MITTALLTAPLAVGRAVVFLTSLSLPRVQGLTP